MQLFSARAAGVLAMVGLSLSLAPCCAVSAATLGPGENLALNRKMEWSRPPDYPRCTDAGDAAQLTDGEISERQWWDQRMVGWQGNARIALTVDLGEVLPVGGVRIRFGGARGNVFYPLWICVFTSDDRKQWFPAGRIRFEDFLGEVNDEQYRTLALEDARAAGRYVCLLMRPQGQYTMLDEVEVLRGGHAPGEVAHDPATALDRPDVVDLYPREEAYVCPEFAIPLNFHKNVQRSGAPGVDLYLPEGVTIAAADAEPVADAFAPQPGAGAPAIPLPLAPFTCAPPGRRVRKATCSWRCRPACSVSACTPSRSPGRSARAAWWWTWTGWTSPTGAAGPASSISGSTSV